MRKIPQRWQFLAPLTALLGQSFERLCRRHSQPRQHFRENFDRFFRIDSGKVIARFAALH